MTKMGLKILFLSACCSILLLPGCSSSNKKTEKLKPTIDELKSAPERVSVGTNEYYVEAYLLRDLMPVISPEDVKGLLVNVKIKSVNGSLKDSILVKHLWVINRDSVWGTVPERIQAADSSSVEVVSRSGPFWEAGVSVDVVVLVQIGNQEKLLQAKEQKINAVY